MGSYIYKITKSLTGLISELSENPSLFLRNPKTDFSRNRKINFKKFVGITMNKRRKQKHIIIINSLRL